MDNSITVYVIAIVVLLIFSAYFSATETAFTSLNKIKLKTQAGDGDARAAKVLELSEKYDKLLTTILIGNNIVNISMATIGTVLFVALCKDYGATIATVVITCVVLVFGEITPKNIAKVKPEIFAKFSAPILSFFLTILTPFNFIFTLWKNFITRIFKLNSNDTITDDEILTMVEEAETGGGLDCARSELIQNAIELDELTAEDVMTPRPDMEAVDIECSKEELADLFERTGFSRIPVYEEEIDKIEGVIHLKDFHYHVAGTDAPISDFVTPVVFVAETIKAFDLLRKMQLLKTHMAIVIDEYGGTSGLVTMEDIIEELVGEIYDEYDGIPSKDIMPLQNGSYRVQGNANMSKVLNFFDIDEEFSKINTVNGWVSMELDHLPGKDDRFETVIDDKKLKVRVTKADDRRAIEINLVIEDIEEETKEDNK